MKLVEAFALIMRMGSLTKAEAHSGVSKATLSRQLRRLEDQLGVQLLVRHPRKIVPTDAGRAFHAHCDALISHVSSRLEAASTEIQEMSSGGTGRLCILSDNQFLTTFVCHMVRIFLERYPNIACELHVSDRADSPDMEEVDCYVCAQPPNRPNFIGKLVGRLGYGLYASPHYVRVHGTPVTPEDLALHVAIKLRGWQSVQPVLRFNDASHAYRSRFAFHTNDYWVMKTLCIEGLGIALLPDFFVVPEIRNGTLVPVLSEWKPDRRRVYCAYQKQRYMSRKIRAFIELVAKSIADIDSFNMQVASVPNGRKSDSV